MRAVAAATPAPDPAPRAGGPAPAVPTAGAAVVLRPLTQHQVRITGGFWAGRQSANRTAVVRIGYERLVAAGNLDNLRVAAGAATGPVRGPVFMDSDVHKWLEAAAWEYGRDPDPLLLDRIREVTAVVAAAQAPDGYLDSVQQVRFDGQRYTQLPTSHELYCAGHLFQAAVAQARCTPDTALLDVATRLADHLLATFGPGRNEEVDGHPVVETGLVELSRATGRTAYLDLARWFVQARGHGSVERHGKAPTYFSDRVPVRDATTVEGHAVRAVYLAAGAADVAAETGDSGLQDALVRQWSSMTRTKSYVTGGLGARWELEQFGDPYELPPDRAYAETCAAIGSIQWSWRMLLATGDAAYADHIERTLYNAFLPGVSLDGTEFFYVNALQVRDGAHADDERSPALGRRGWFDVACCPPNVMRLLSSLEAYLATSTDAGVQVHQLVTGTIASAHARLTLTTGYPWDGEVRIEVSDTDEEPWEVAVRVPGWAVSATASVNGHELTAPAPGYLRVRRVWTRGDILVLSLPMDVRAVRPHPRIDAVRGCVAVERGPLVYCLEAADAGGAVVDDVRVGVADVHDAQVVDEPGLLGGVTSLTLSVAVLQDPGTEPYRPVRHPESDLPAVHRREPVRLVPYFAWANRGPGAMRVWLPLAEPDRADPQLRW